MIGVLALQGGFAAHLHSLNSLGMPTREVRLAKDLEGLRALILPGGESTTMLKLIAAFDLFKPLSDFGKQGRPILGTCAGAILMSQTVANATQLSFGFLPVTIERNAYGSQRESFRAEVACSSWDLERVPALFIRAPRFCEPLEPGVEVLSRTKGGITGITYQNFVGVTYHPELGGETDFHHAWLQRYVVGAGH